MKAKRWKNQYIELITTLPDYILAVHGEEPSAEGLEFLQIKKEQFQEIFVELGSGSGGHLVEQARRSPQALFVGFELRFKRTFLSGKKAKAQHLNNFIVIHGKAQLIGRFFSPQTISGVYINFPDPWSKRRWLKHRLLTPTFLAEIHGLLKPGGFVSYKTDHRDYFQQILESAQASNLWQVKKLTYDLKESLFQAGNVSSEFEKLFISKHIPICLLELVKPTSPHRV